MYNKEYEKALIKYAYHEKEYDFISPKVANVHDDLPHLVHADYLEEKGNETAADFIRKTVEGRTKDPEKFKITTSHYTNLKRPMPHGRMQVHFFPNITLPPEVRVGHYGPTTDGSHLISYIQTGDEKELKDVHDRIKEELDKHDD